ncbi:hypothetical protein ASG33_08105 [Dyadobacter sp. Leaf189]|nr:hypothetical protein ASG33_08105 [Dyadobacter sp. Leaf189]
MNFDFPGYKIKFIQRDVCRNECGGHLSTFIYKFFSPVTGYKYIMRVEHYELETFAIKFYCQKHSSHDYKYSITTNKGDLGNIMATCLSAVEEILALFPDASFVFLGAPSYDKRSKTIENKVPTQRFKIYRYIASKLIGRVTFEHFEYEAASSYSLINRRCEDVPSKERMMVKMFRFTYPTLRDMQI